MKKPVLSPSLLSADMGHLKEALALIEKKNGAAVHIDVMDGIFVPEITYGQPVVRCIRKFSKLPFDVHLMVEHPENQIDSFIESGADWITFHYEGNTHIHRMIEHIHDLGKKAGIAFVPSTSTLVLSEILPYADIVLVMTVNPGFGGQALIPSCLKKIAELKTFRETNGCSYSISVDGGVNEKTLASVLAAGADIVVSGSAFFSGTLSWPV